MPFELHPLVKEDATEVARLTVESYKNNPFRRIVFPNGMGQASVDKIIDSQIKAVDNPDKYGVKIVNTETGEMAACAMWEHTIAMSEEDWVHEREKAMEGNPDVRVDLVGEFIHKSQDAQQRVKKNERWWELLSLSTLPKYQRQGIGSMLMKWGNSKQEEMKLPGFIEATDQGYGLYIKHGYREIERWEFDMGEWSELGGSGMYKNVYLVRDLPGDAAP